MSGDNSDILTNEYWNAVIEPNSSIEIGFIYSK